MTPFLQPNAQDKANQSKFTRPKAILALSPSGRYSSLVSSPREVPESHVIETQHTHRRIVPYRRGEVRHTMTANRRDLRVSSIATMRRESEREAVTIRRRYLPWHSNSTVSGLLPASTFWAMLLSTGLPDSEVTACPFSILHLQARPIRHTC